MTITPLARRLAAAAVLTLSSAGTLAAPDEIQVYTEELNDPGAFGLEMHVKLIPQGRKGARVARRDAVEPRAPAHTPSSRTGSRARSRPGCTCRSRSRPAATR